MSHTRIWDQRSLNKYYVEEKNGEFHTTNGKPEAGWNSP